MGELYIVEVTTYTGELKENVQKDNLQDAEKVYEEFKVKYPHCIITLDKRFLIKTRHSEIRYE